MENYTDIQEQLFHNAVRENIVSLSFVFEQERNWKKITFYFIFLNYGLSEPS